MSLADSNIIPNSNLSSVGCDLVVAFNQVSINSTFGYYINSGSMPVLSVYYSYGASVTDTPVLTSLAALSEACKSSGLIPDPLNQPSWNESQTVDATILSYQDCLFAFAFRIQLGGPEGYNKWVSAGVITLNEDGTSVTFRLLCSQFVVAIATYDEQSGAMTEFTNESQQDGEPWIIEVNVPMNAMSSDANLPPSVQSYVDTFSANTVSVQQLLLDYASGTVTSVPTIPGVTPGSAIYTALIDAVMQTYFNELEQLNMPAIAYAVQSNGTSSTDVTACELVVNRYRQMESTALSAKSKEVVTLNYVFALGGSTLPVLQPSPFDWNWFDPADEQSEQGVIALCSKYVPGVFDQALSTYVGDNCYVAQPEFAIDSNGIITCQGNFVKGGQPTIAYNPEPGVLLSYFFESNPPAVSAAQTNGPYGSLMGYSQFSLQLMVGTEDNTISITQSLIIYAQMMVSNSVTGNQELCVACNPVNVKYVGNYSIMLSEEGIMSFAPIGTPVETPAINLPNNIPYSGNFSRQTVANFTETLQDVIYPQEFNLQQSMVPDIHLNPTYGGVFPGGNTFVYNGVAFSTAGDLLFRISYEAIN